MDLDDDDDAVDGEGGAPSGIGVIAQPSTAAWLAIAMAVRLLSVDEMLKRITSMVVRRL